MNENSQLKSPEEILKKPYKYKEPCGRLRDDPAFNGKGNFFKCDEVIDEETGEECGAPKYCHLSSKPSCTLTRQEIMSDKAVYMASNDLCITCLKSHKVCCLVGDHPSEEDKNRVLIQVSREISNENNQKNDVNFKKLNFFFQSILLKDNIEKSDRIWTFKNNCHWLSEDYKTFRFLNRECYDYFIDVLNSLRDKNYGVNIIQGTPGIGKSSFYNTLIHYIIENYRNSKETQEITIFYQIKRPTGPQENYFITIKKENDSLSHNILIFGDGQKPECEYHLLDTVSNNTFLSKRFTFFVASYKDENLQFYNNGNLKIGFKAYMPVFTFKELCEISPANWSDEQRQYRYSILGGCARNYLYQAQFPIVQTKLSEALELLTPPNMLSKLSKKSPKNKTSNFFHFESVYQVLNDAINASNDAKKINLFSRTMVHYKLIVEKYEIIRETEEEEQEEEEEKKKKKRRGRKRRREEEETKKIVKKIVDEDAAIKLSFDILKELHTGKPNRLTNYNSDHYYKFNFVPQWSSPIVKQVVGILTKDQDTTLWENLSKLFTGSTMGGIFEASAHFHLISSKPSLKFKRLLPSNKYEYLQINFAEKISSVRYLWDHSGAESLLEGEYGFPLKQTFEAVDAIIQPNILIQITARDKHPIEIHHMEYARSFLHANYDEHILIYIIDPTDGFSFKINDFSVFAPSTRKKTRLPNDIKQYVGFINIDENSLKKLTINK